MSNPISWRFEDTPLWFTSTPERLNAHIRKARRDLEVSPDTKIIYSNAGSSPSILLGSGVIINGVPYASMAEFYSCNKPRKTPQLSDMPNLVDNSHNSIFPFPTPTPVSPAGSGNFGRGL